MGFPWDGHLKSTNFTKLFVVFIIENSFQRVTEVKKIANTLKAKNDPFFSGGISKTLWSGQDSF